MRRLAWIPLLLLIAACPTYDRYKYVSSQKGLMSPDEFARYGPDQAISMAIGREFGHAHSGSTAADFARQAGAAIDYAKKFPQVKNVVADTLGYRLVVTFTDGWTTQVTPITDGKRGDQTAHLPKANQGSPAS
ncbi:MAG: hypothetical protein ACREL5_01920 [Gemmatimonadales bacterium]